MKNIIAWEEAVDVNDFMHTATWMRTMMAEVWFENFEAREINVAWAYYIAYIARKPQ